MASVVIKGNSSGSGSVTIEAPNTNATPAFILPSADGTSGQVLQTNGSGALSFTTPATGAFVFLSTVDLSNNATADFTLPSGYDAYQFVFGNVIPATDNAVFWLRTSSNGGSTFDAGISDYGWGNIDPAGASDTSDSEIQLTAADGVGSAAGEDGVSGNVIVYFPHLTKSTLITSAVSMINTSGNVTTGYNISSVRYASAVVDAVRFLFSTGNLESGSITLYGMKNS